MELLSWWQMIDLVLLAYLCRHFADVQGGHVKVEKLSIFAVRVSNEPICVQAKFPNVEISLLIKPNDLFIRFS